MRTSRLNPDTVPAPLGTYSHSVRVETSDGTWIYVSGQIATDSEGNLVAPNDLPAQSERVFENLKSIREANGYGSLVVVPPSQDTQTVLGEPRSGIA